MDQFHDVRPMDLSRTRAREVLLLLIEGRCGNFLPHMQPHEMPTFGLKLLRYHGLAETLPFSATDAIGRIKWLHPSMLDCLEDIEANRTSFTEELIERQVAFFYDDMNAHYSSYIDMSEGEVLRSIEYMRSAVKKFTAHIPTALGDIRSQVAGGQAFWAEIRQQDCFASVEGALHYIHDATIRYDLDHQAAWTIAVMATDACPWSPNLGTIAYPTALTSLACAASRLVDQTNLIRPPMAGLERATALFAAYSDAVYELDDKVSALRVAPPIEICLPIIHELVHRDDAGLAAFNTEICARDWLSSCALRLEHGFLLAEPGRRLHQIVSALECAVETCNPANHVRMRLVAAAEARLAEVGLDVEIRLRGERVEALARVP